MSDQGSRRDFLKLSASGLAGIATRPLGAQQAPADAATLDRIQKLLATPVDGETLEIMKRTVRGNEAAAAGRTRFKLPENSEPCTVYRPVKPGKRP